MRNFIFIFCCSLLFTACENDLEEVNKFINKDDVSIEIANDVEIIYSDSAFVKVKIKSPLMKRYLTREDPHEQFPDGIDVVFFGDRSNKPQSHLTSKFATRREKKGEIVVRDSVVWWSEQGERLETEELIWNEKKRIVHTNRFVTIYKADEVINGFGFEANEEFTHWKIKSVDAQLDMKDMTKEFE